MLHLTQFYEALKKQGINSSRANNIAFEFSRHLNNQGITRDTEVAKVIAAMKEVNDSQLGTNVKIVRGTLNPSDFKNCKV